MDSPVRIAGVDLLEWICWSGFAREDLPAMIRWCGFTGVDLPEWIYWSGFTGVDLLDLRRCNRKYKLISFLNNFNHVSAIVSISY